MRTYDKLIATIHTRQGAGDLRACFGSSVVRRGRSGERLARPLYPQDDPNDNTTP